MLITSITFFKVVIILLIAHTVSVHGNTFIGLAGIMSENKHKTSEKLQPISFILSCGLLPLLNISKTRSAGCCLFYFVLFFRSLFHDSQRIFLPAYFPCCHWMSAQAQRIQSLGQMSSRKILLSL